MAVRKRVVIVGGGFGGLAAARALSGDDVGITLIDRRNHHLFQPLLYQVATAVLSPSDIADPIRGILSAQEHVEVVLDEVTAFDLDQRHVLLGERRIPYDYLVVAAGVSHSYFGHPEWAAHAPGLKTIGDALEIRQRILSAFEKAEWTDDRVEQRRLLTFVVVGGGPTGVEMAGAIAEIACKTLVRDFRRFDPRETRVVLVEGGSRLLAAFPEDLSASAKVQLESLGVEVRFGAAVTGVDADGVRLGDERIESRTVVWAAGVQASPLGQALGAELDRAGRVKVTEGLNLPDRPEVFVIGDLASATDAAGKPLPGLAPVATQQGRFVAATIRGDARGTPRGRFDYVDRGSMATIGSSLAIAQVKGFHFSGFIAWILWVFIHLIFLVDYRNRVVVMVKWAWSWVAADRSARLLWQGERGDVGPR